MGYWGWTQGNGVLRPLLAILIPLLAAAIWGIFRVPDDPGRAPVPVPGVVRLAIELAFFGLAVWMQVTSLSPQGGSIFAIIVLLHYTISYDRVLWLLKQ